MNEKSLSKISLIGFLVCISILYIITLSDFTNSVSIGEIDESYVGKTVNITGTIRDFFVKDGNMFFDVEDETGKIKVVLWEDTVDVMESKGTDMKEMGNGNKINIVGNVQIYMGELEVLPIHGKVHLIG